ncbi:unnamed protein product, partial [Amoebophrya sp. A25]
WRKEHIIGQRDETVVRQPLLLDHPVVVSELSHSIVLHRDARERDRTLIYVGAADYDEAYLDRSGVLSRYRHAWFFEADPVAFEKLSQNVNRYGKHDYVGRLRKQHQQSGQLH